VPAPYKEAGDIAMVTKELREEWYKVAADCRAKATLLEHQEVLARRLVIAQRLEDAAACLREAARLLNVAARLKEE
jgi:hypothetical protein